MQETKNLGAWLDALNAEERTLALAVRAAKACQFLHKEEVLATLDYTAAIEAGGPRERLRWPLRRRMPSRRRSAPRSSAPGARVPREASARDNVPHPLARIVGLGIPP